MKFIQNKLKWVNIKLYGNFAAPQESKLNKFFINKFVQRTDFLNSMHGHVYPEIFEFKCKSKFAGANLISKDVSDLTMLDNFKENYPYTVSIFFSYNLNKYKYIYISNMNYFITFL